MVFAEGCVGNLLVLVAGSGRRNVRANIDESTLDLDQLLLPLTLFCHVFPCKTQMCTELIDGAEGLKDLAILGKAFAGEEG